MENSKDFPKIRINALINPKADKFSFSIPSWTNWISYKYLSTLISCKSFESPWLGEVRFSLDALGRYV